MRTKLPSALFCCLWAVTALAQSPYQSSSDFAKYAQKLRENALLKIEPQVFIPTAGGVAVSGRYPWRVGIVTTIFWIGENAGGNNPVPNRASSWDPDWMRNYGGYDTPDSGARRGYYPASFTPQLNPFYCALPYNDVTHGSTKPEAPRVIPWFKQTFQKFGQSVCHDRWVAIRNPKNGRIAYAQWSDCGPFRTDHWEYVFGNPMTHQWERPKPNLNGGAGLDVSPAVRDYLGINATRDVTDWKFVDAQDVPTGPWARYGENNTFVLNARKSTERVASKIQSAPTVITK
jgi:hypothetical protein